MTTYYCIKETGEVIGTHNDWLALRDNQPERYKELNNTRKIELVRTGPHGWPKATKEQIARYGLEQVHKDECHKHMKSEVEELERLLANHWLEIDTAGPFGKAMLLEEAEKIEHCLVAYTEAIAKGATRFPNYDANGFELTY